MLYRENGQFKTTYQADSQIFPIRQDRWAMLIFIAFIFIGVPLLASDYLFLSIINPFLILALAAIGLNLLVGLLRPDLARHRCLHVGGRLYRLQPDGRAIPGMNLIVAFLLAGGVAMVFGVLFGIPSLRIRGLYLAVATLAAQFFADWAFQRIGWLTNYSSSGSVSVPRAERLRLDHRHAGREVPASASASWWSSR